MAREAYVDRVEIFAFNSSGLAAALTEAAEVVTTHPGRFAVEDAALRYVDGAHRVVLPYRRVVDVDATGLARAETAAERVLDEGRSTAEIALAAILAYQEATTP